MKVTWNWLNDFIDLSGIEIDDLSEQLGAQGLEIDEIEYPEEALSNIVIGFVQSIKNHPDADNLKIAMVDVGSKKIQLISGADNIRENIYVPVALAGAELYGNKVKKIKLRGKTSEGMICSLEELGLEDKSSGIFVFDNLNKKDIGNNALAYLGLDDIILDFEITFNRSDCLSVLGIAREIAMATDRELSIPSCDYESEFKDVNEKVDVKIKDYEKCYRYTARFIENISFKKTPLWMRSRLELVGLRSINIVVDITNYVMWEIGLPLHAFDGNLVKDNSIIIRSAYENESFLTLTDDDLKLNSDNLVIADKEKPIALAGIIGGANSEITEKTKSVMLEAALFDPINIRYTAKKFGLSTDSSYRFERGMDYGSISLASKRASYLMSKYANAKVYKGVCEDRNENFEPTPKVTMRWNRVQKLLGFDVDKKKLKYYFKKLNYDIVKENSKLLKVKVPSYRYWDVNREVDLIEEVVRLTGYDNIPMTLPKIKIKNVNVDKREHLMSKVNKILQGYGAFEVYSFPFINKEDMDILDIDKEQVYKISNPMTKELEYMSCEPLISLLKITEKNLKRRNGLIKIYEWGRTYSKSNGEKDILSLLLTGKFQKTIYNEERQLDYFDIKAIVEKIVSILDIENYEFTKFEKILWDENLSYSVKIDDNILIEFGKINERVAETYDIKSNVWGLYLYVDKILDYYSISRNYKEYSFFPPVYFDLAFIVDKEVASGQIKELIKDKAGKDLESIRLFDVYEGKPLDENKKSLAYSLVFRSFEKTLKEEDVNQNIDNIINEVKEQFNAKLRE